MEGKSLDEANFSQNSLNKHLISVNNVGICQFSIHNHHQVVQILIEYRKAFHFRGVYRISRE